MGSYQEDELYNLYNEIERRELRSEFNNQINKMKGQDKHKHKTNVEKWEYALYRITGGVSKKRY